MAHDALCQRPTSLRPAPAAAPPGPPPNLPPAPRNSSITATTAATTAHPTSASTQPTNHDEALFPRLRALNPSSSALEPAFVRPNPILAPRSHPHIHEQHHVEQLIRQTQQLLKTQGASTLPETYLVGADDAHQLSDHESIGDIEREAQHIIRMATDQVTLERAAGMLPPPSAHASDATEPADAADQASSYGGVLSRDDLDLEVELADAAQDADFHAVASRSTSGRSYRRARWSFRSNIFTLLALVVLVSLCMVPGAYAFGAGNIPSFSYLEGKAFRHGDLADTLSELARKSGGGMFGSSKFSGIAIKRIYFGNWLRDYSQAMDVAALQKMSKQAILNIVMLLGFLAHGYATAEFEVTDERLGTYLPEEHLDNPKGYADGKDARQYDPRLRPPVDPQELEIDPRSGMKNYLANETGSWPTGSALIRRTLKRCIDQGRLARQSGREADLWEAYRLLGQALHTLEDLPAHSNWCELALRKLGYHSVFLHVGDNVTVQAPDGTRIAPLVTGTFGSADFIHSLLGEAQDHLSEASISDLNKAIDDARSKSTGNNRSPLQDLLGSLTKIPGGGGESFTRDLEDISRGPAEDPSQMSPKELYKNLWKILTLRDRIAKSIEVTIEKIPGLSSLVEKLTNELNVFVFTLIEPYAKPIMQQGMGALHLGSTAVINKEDQFEVFNNPNASDPTHSMLSKDHFGLILNEVAGNVAQIIVRHTVKLVVKAWDDTSIDAELTADECLAPMFHPYWFSGRSQVQKEMLDYMAQWAQSHPEEIKRLDREHVRNHTNTRTGKAEPHTHGGDQPSISSFIGGSTSQAAHQFAPSGHHNTHHGGGSGGGGSMGAQMASYASNYVSGQVHNAFGGVGGGGGGGGGHGLFREGPSPSGNESVASATHTHDAPNHGQHSSSQHAPHHVGHSGSYYDDTDRARRQGSGSIGYGESVAPSGFGHHGNESSYGGGSISMPDESSYAAQSGFGGPPGGAYPGQSGGFAPSGPGGGYPGQHYGPPSAELGGFAPPPGAPMAPYGSGGPGGFGQGPPRPPYPPPGGYQGGYSGGGGYGGGY
ncbi:hypothetical protein ACQY0O_001867 [Thecaphora frezii]